MNNPTRTYYDNGQLLAESYYVGNNLHRTDRPAFTLWHDNGQLMFEEYWVNGEIHREDGPAAIWWDENGNITTQEFFLNNDEVTAYDVLGDTPEAFAWVLANE